MSTVFTDRAASGRRCGWVFYDANCAFCTGLALWLEPTLLRRGFHCSPLQDRWVALALGIAREELAREFRVWTRRRELLSGADAIVFLAGEIWWAWPVFMLAKLPGLRSVVHAAYRWMAVRRNCSNANREACVQRSPWASTSG
jgi:predicted DCC family thiol-disulfide oxidoreductase YuxK